MAVAILAEDGVRHCLGCRNDHNEHKVLAQIMSCGAWQKARPSTFSTLGFPQACKTPAAAGLERRAEVWERSAHAGAPGKAVAREDRRRPSHKRKQVVGGIAFGAALLIWLDSSWSGEWPRVHRGIQWTGLMLIGDI